MSEPVVISKAKPASKSQDYNGLVAEGLDFIRQWASDTWTDHNVHDPGITLLETLCYAITELGYRGQIDIRQLLGGRVPPEATALYSPARALSCDAITAQDFQKLLITLPDVKIAWLKPADTPVRGLYDVLIEWEDGNLNDSLIQETILANGKSFGVEFAFPYWDEESVSVWRNNVTLNQVTGIGQPLPQLIAFSEDELNDYFTNVEVRFSTNRTTRLTVVIRLTDQPELADRPALELAIVNRLTDVSAGSPIDTYRSRVTTVFQQMNNVRTLLADHRNLGEDFAGFKSVRTQEIAIRASVELSVEADAQQTLIDMLSAIDLFIDPVVRFSTLSDMQQAGLSVDAIFDGPLLSTGFLPTLSEPDQPLLYASDLLRLMLQHPVGQRNNAVIAIENFAMNSYVRNRLHTANAINSIALLTADQFQPRLSVAKSDITFFRNGAEVSYDRNQVAVGIQAKRRQAFALSTASTLPVSSPLSTDSDWTPEAVADYQSVQYDLPLIYGLRADTPDAAPALRKAQEKQFRGYLLFFEQILANHLSQLANTASFFSIDGTTTTYFYQPLYSTPQIDQLLRAFNPADDWNAFVADPANPYVRRLQTLAESPMTMLQRKNRVLEHLLGRFGEELSELSRLEYTLNQQDATSLEAIERIRLATARRLLRYKAAFLRDVCESAGGRAVGVPHQSITALSGLERRIYRKTGILQQQRRKLVRPLTDFFEVQNVGGNRETFRLKDVTNAIILTSTQTFPTGPTRSVFDGMRTVVKFGVEPAYFQIDQSGAAQWRVSMLNEAGVAIAQSADTFSSPANAQTFIDTTAPFLYDTYSYEGFYLIEHVLLRPSQPGDAELELGSKSDPYSFQITLVFPSGFERDFAVANNPVTPDLPHRFRQKDFRNYVEAVVQQECPAHIIPRIFWLDANVNPAAEPTLLSFNTLETTYQSWLGHFVANTLGTPAGVDARSQLVKTLNGLFATLT